MAFPSFFSDVPAIVVRDPLSQFLGATDDGLLTFDYVDAVKLAGHSCPTVAGAYMMCAVGLAALYPDEIPVRGDIDVQFRAPRHEGVVGVMASVASLITGARGDDGFKGIGGRFTRSHLLRFENAGLTATMLMETSGGRRVTLDFDASRVSPDPEMSRLLPAAFQSPTSAEAGRFARLWQERVRRILTEHWADPQIVTCQLA